MFGLRSTSELRHEFNVYTNKEYYNMDVYQVTTGEIVIEHPSGTIRLASDKEGHQLLQKLNNILFDFILK